MFGFLNMIGNYDQRAVANFTPEGAKDWLVDTAAVSDSAQPFETAVQHPRYNSGKMVIVEMYDTKEQARVGHDKWVKTMTADKLPDTLKDVSSCDICQLMDALGDDHKWRTKKAKTPKRLKAAKSSNTTKRAATRRKK